MNVLFFFLLNEHFKSEYNIVVSLVVFERNERNEVNFCRMEKDLDKLK